MEEFSLKSEKKIEVEEKQKKIKEAEKYLRENENAKALFQDYKQQTKEAAKEIGETEAETIFHYTTNAYSDRNRYLRDKTSGKGREIQEEYENLTVSKTDRDAFNGKFQIVINCKTGKDIAAYSSFPHEQEVLYKAGSRFKIRHITGDMGEMIFVELDEVQ